MLKRPETYPFPNTWDQFQGQIEIKGKRNEYKIQDVTEELIDPVIDHMFRYYVVRERSLSHEGLIEDQEAVEELKQLYREKLEKKMSLVTIVVGDGEESKRIAGCSILGLTRKDDPEYKGDGRCMRRLVSVVSKFYSKVNIFEKFGVEMYLNGWGLSVAPQYQGDNIGYHLIKARTSLCQMYGIPLIVTMYSNPAAHKQAVRNGCQVLLEEPIENLKLDNELAFPRMKGVTYTLTANVVPKLNEI